MRKWLVMLGFVVLAALLSALPASASHSWGNYHWARTSTSFTLKAGDNVDSKWDVYLNEAIADWNKSTVLDLAKVAGGTTGRRCRPTAGRIEVCNAAYGQNGWLGLASIWASGSHITQGTAKMNDSYFNLPQYDTPAWRRLVMCQEVAHDFGLGHQDENFDNKNLGSCMDYTGRPAGGNGELSNEHPNQHDYDMLATIYSHLDSSTTIGMSTDAMPAGVSDVDLDTPAQWGRLVHDTGRVSVYVREFGGGIRIITHVFWVEGRGNASGR